MRGTYRGSDNGPQTTLDHFLSGGSLPAARPVPAPHAEPPQPAQAPEAPPHQSEEVPSLRQDDLVLRHLWSIYPATITLDGILIKGILPPATPRPSLRRILSNLTRQGYVIRAGTIPGPGGSSITTYRATTLGETENDTT